MTAKRILLLDTGKEWGGGTNSMIELLKRIDRQRFDITALFYRDYRKGNGSTLGAELAAIGIPLHLLPLVQPPWWEKPAKELARAFGFGNRERARRLVFAIERRTRIEPMAKRIAAEIRGGGFDLLYMNNQPASNLEGYLAAELASIPVIQHARIDIRLLPEEVDIATRLATRVICNSHGVQRSLVSQGIPAQRCLVVHNGIDLNQPIPEPAQFDRSSQSMLVGTVSSLVKRKCIDHLIRAVSNLNRSGILSVECLVVGEGPEEANLRKITSDLGLTDKVHFVGFQPDPLAWIQLMDLFVFPSLQEGFGRVLIEAMLLKKPVVAADVIGPNEVVADRQTGYLFESGNVGQLSAIMQMILTSPDIRATLGENGYCRVKERFSIEQYISGIEAVFSDVLKA